MKKVLWMASVAALSITACGSDKPKTAKGPAVNEQVAALPGCISGTYHYGEGESTSGAAGMKVALTAPDQKVAYSTTNEKGEYQFCDLEPGRYQVNAEVPSSDFWIQSKPGLFQGYDVDLQSGNGGLDFASTCYQNQAKDLRHWRSAAGQSEIAGAWDALAETGVLDSVQVTKAAGKPITDPKQLNAFLKQGDANLDISLAVRLIALQLNHVTEKVTPSSLVWVGAPQTRTIGSIAAKGSKNGLSAAQKQRVAAEINDLLSQPRVLSETPCVSGA